MKLPTRLDRGLKSRPAQPDRAPYALAEAFARAEHEHAELARLKAAHQQFSGLHFRRHESKEDKSDEL